VKRARQRARETLDLQAIQDAILEPFPAHTAKRGPIYDKIRAHLDDVRWEEWIRRIVTDAQIAQELGLHAASVGRARRFATNEFIAAQQAITWTAADEFASMLGPTDEVMKQLLAENPEQFESMLDVLADAFVAWRTHFFRSGFEVTYITRAVHRHWIRTILRTIYLGERSMILSPPRHGKTDLLIHFCVWMILRNPNIRILYVGPNQEIAENCVGQVKTLLEDSEALAEAYLAPGQSWAPQNPKGALWRDSKFRVMNRSIPLKQPTMWAAGVGGKLLSIDADFIIIDDPADPDDSQQQAGRLKTSKWFKMKLLTRKMRHTGLAMISSRCHFEDLYSEYIDNPKWNVVVDKAHDYGICGRNLFDDHAGLADPQACLLFPEMNPLDHLQDQAVDIGDALFEMMFQNEPRPETGQTFDVEQIKARCLDKSRIIGPPVNGRIPGIFGEVTLVAGIDPAARQTQAGFLWAIDLAHDTDYMIDLQTQEAGGIDGAIALIRYWNEVYGCQIFVIEDNGFQIFYHTDPRVMALKADIPGLMIVPCSTQGNKHDPDFGVAGMAARYHAGKVNLPYGNPETRRAVDRLIRQMAVFSSETGVRSKNKSDILMASWVPMPDVVRRMRKGAGSGRPKNNSPRSFPDWYPDNYAGQPWPSTVYPQ